MRSGLDERLCVQAIFSVHGDDDEGAYAALTELIDRLNQVANLPECECDLDISVERGAGHDLPPSDMPGAMVASSSSSAAGL